MTTAAHCLYLGVALPLAAGALVDAWRNGSIFAGSRAAVEATLESDATGLRGFLAAMLNCPFCLGYHVPWLLLLTGYGPARLLEATDWGRWAWLPLLPSCSLAATRVARLIDGLLPERLRYARHAE